MRLWAQTLERIVNMLVVRLLRNGMGLIESDRMLAATLFLLVNKLEI